MKAKPIKFVEGKPVDCPAHEATHVTLRLPGPSGVMTLPVILKGARAGTGCWSWNGDVDKPTLRPSVLVTSGHHVQGFDAAKDSCWCKYYQAHPEEKPVFHCHRCHTWINDGQAQFLPDSTHEFANQTVALLDVD